MPSFFKKLARGTDHFFKKADSGTDKFFRKTLPHGIDKAAAVTQSVAKKVGNGLEKVAKNGQLVSDGLALAGVAAGATGFGAPIAVGLEGAAAATAAASDSAGKGSAMFH